MFKAKPILLVTICIVSLILATPAYSARASKIGVIDFKKILQQSERGKEIKDDLGKQLQQRQADLDKKSREIEELKKKLEREALVMSKAMGYEKRRELRIKINDIKELKAIYERETSGIEKQMLRRMQKEVVKLVEELAKKEGFQMVLDKTAGGVVYAPDAIDLTDKVIKKYNAAAKKKKK